MKTLFLDFDGVLHPTLAQPGRLFALAPALSAAIAHLPCEIVVSSSWRFQLPLVDLLQRLPDPLAARVIDVTGPAIIGRYARHQEIQAWLSLHAPRDWRALDDSAYEFPSPCPQLIRCDGARGITDQNLDVLVQWLTIR